MTTKPAPEKLLWTGLDWNADTDEFRLNGIAPTRVSEPPNGPLIVEHKLVLDGRPTSVYDIALAYADQQPVSKWQRTVPVDRDFSRSPMQVLTHPTMFEAVHHSDLHREFLGTLKWRGRPSSFLHFRLDVLREWRDAVFAGTLTIRDLAKAAKVSEPAAFRFAHGETLWWL